MSVLADARRQRHGKRLADGDLHRADLPGRYRNADPGRAVYLDANPRYASNVFLPLAGSTAASVTVLTTEASEAWTNAARPCAQ